MTPATIVASTERFIVCPGCNEPTFRIDHMDEEQIGRKFGPWSCKECGVHIRGRTRAFGGADIEIDTRCRPNLKGLMLVEIGESTPPVYAVLRTTIYDGGDGYDFDKGYFVDEHTCPINLIRAAAILRDGNTDPHGVLRFIQLIQEPEGFEEDNLSWEDWVMLFDQFPGQIIEGEGRAAQAPQVEGPK